MKLPHKGNFASGCRHRRAPVSLLAWGVSLPDAAGEDRSRLGQRGFGTMPLIEHLPRDHQFTETEPERGLVIPIIEL